MQGFSADPIRVPSFRFGWSLASFFSSRRNLIEKFDEMDLPWARADTVGISGFNGGAGTQRQATIARADSVLLPGVRKYSIQKLVSKQELTLRRISENAGAAGARLPSQAMIKSLNFSYVNSHTHFEPQGQCPDARRR